MSKGKTLAAALLTMLLWGSLFPFVKLGFTAFGVVSTADVLTFAGIRFVICGTAICILACIKDHRSFIPVKDSIIPILASGLFAIILHYSFTYLGLELTDSSKTAILKQFGAVFYVCFSFLFIKEDRPTLVKIIASAIGFFGIFVLNMSSEGFVFSAGDLFILCASFCTVFSNVISKNVFKKVSPITSTGVSQLFGGAILLTVGLAMGTNVSFSFDNSLWIMIYICIASVVSYCMWFGIVKNAELSKLFIIKFTEPVFACIFGALLLGEDIFRVQYLLAFLLISASIWISNIEMKSRKK